MMNQRIIIYIILSAILLYLYYRRRDITVFAAFIVVVGSTLIFRNGSTSEGFGIGIGGGGGDKVDSECAKIGYTAPKIDKKDIPGSLEKVMKSVWYVMKVQINKLNFQQIVVIGFVVNVQEIFYFGMKEDIIYRLNHLDVLNVQMVV